MRPGGYFSRTEFYGDIHTGMGLDHLYEIHGRIVLDYLSQLWKVQWIGIGGLVAEPGGAADHARQG